MGNFAFDADGVELHCGVLEIADGKQAVADFEVFEDRGGDGGDTDAFGGEEFKQGGVFDFGDNVGGEVLSFEPFFDGAAKDSVWCGEQQWLAFEGIGILIAEPIGVGLCANPGNAAFSQGVIIGFDADLGTGGAVRENQVGFVNGEVGEKVGEFAFVADELDFLGHAEDRFDQSKRDLFGKEVGDADCEGDDTVSLGAFEAFHEFLAGGEDFFGVVEDESADFGESEFATFAFVEFAADRFFELPELAADGGLGEVEFRGGAADAAFAGDVPEVQQVVVIQPIHRDAPGRSTKQGNTEAKVWED